MKTTFITLVISLMAGISFAQSPYSPKTFHYNFTGSQQISRTTSRTTSQQRSEAAKVSLDSSVTTGNYKVVFTYDGNGNCVLQLGYSWDKNTSRWNASGRTESNYDINGYETLYADYSLDKSKTQWIGGLKNEHTYDANGNVTLNVYSFWDTTSNGWLSSSKTAYTYDTYKNITSKTTSYFDKSNKKWSDPNVSTYKNTLGINNKAVLSIVSMPLAGVVHDVSKIVNTYDLNGYLDSTVNYYWDDMSINKWVFSTKDEYAYDANGNKTLDIYYQWNKTANKWVGLFKYEYAYDVSGNKTLEASYNWDTTTTQWTGSYKILYNYDISIQSNTLATYFTSSKGHVNKVTSYSGYSWENGGWKLFPKDILYYSDGPTGLLDETLQVNNKKLLRIYNQLGVEVKPEQTNFGLLIYQYSDGSTKKVMRHE